MTRSKKSFVEKNPAASAVKHILDLFGPPPLLSTESPKHFKRILGGFITAVEPVGAIEQIWVYDIAVLVWEMMRLRSYKAMIIERQMPEAFQEIAKAYIGDDGESNSPKYATDKDARDREARQILADAIADYNLTIDVVAAEAFCFIFIEEIEFMLATLHVRRDTVIREIGAYRDSLARRVKKAADEVIEIPAQEVEITPRLAPPASKRSTAA